MKRVIILLAICSLVACSPKTLNYFEVSPFFKPTVARFEEPLYLEFGSHINDDLSIAQPGMRTLYVHEFKQSLRYALKQTFDDQFSSVEFRADEKKGFVLRLFRMEPSWWLGEEKEVIRKEFKDTMHVRDFGCRIQYESTLYYNGEKVSDASGEVLKKAGYDTEQAYSKVWTIEEIFQETVKLSCEDMAKKISERK